MNAVDLNILANRLRTRRVELGLTQESLAERAQINQSTVSLLERGDQAPTLNSLIQITQALDISMDWLLGVTDELKFTDRETDLDPVEKEALGIIRSVDHQYRARLLQIMKLVVEFRRFES